MDILLVRMMSRSSLMVQGTTTSLGGLGSDGMSNASPSFIDFFLREEEMPGETAPSQSATELTAKLEAESSTLLDGKHISCFPN